MRWHLNNHCLLDMWSVNEWNELTQYCYRHLAICRHVLPCPEVSRYQCIATPPRGRTSGKRAVVDGCFKFSSGRELISEIAAASDFRLYHTSAPPVSSFSLILCLCFSSTCYSLVLKFILQLLISMLMFDNPLYKFGFS
jgi:hypothetical protein